jgi:hypothetical protein
VYEMKNLVVVPDYRNLGAAGFTGSEVGDADERVTPITGLLDGPFSTAKIRLRGCTLT